MVINPQADDQNFVIATRDSKGAYAMVYFPTGKTVNLNFSKLKGSTFNSWWFDPRTGNAFKGPLLDRSIINKIEPPTFGKGHDWVLVVDNS